MNNKKCLVTGGAGYIGSHASVELFKRDYDVIIVDNLSNSNISSIDNIEKVAGKRPIFYNFDLLDGTRLAKVFEDNSDIVGVIHFAGLKAVGESVEKPLKYYRNNLVSILNVLELMEKDNLNNLIFSSSACVYGEPKEMPVTEKTLVQAQTSPYGNTKKIIEEEIKDYCLANKNFNSIILRYFNVVGAHPSGGLGELPNGVPNNLVPRLAQAVSGKQEALQVFGNDFKTPDGYGVRDYIHVMDLVDAHIVALERMIEKQNKNNLEIYNLGIGKGVSVMELINAFEKVTGKKVPYKLAARRAGDIDEIYADVSLAEKELKWKAERSIEDALRDVWRWEENQLRINPASLKIIN